MANEQGIDPTANMYISLLTGTSESGNFAQAWQYIEVLENSPDVSNSELLDAYSITKLPY